MTKSTMTQHKILYILPQPFLTNRGSSFRAWATVEELCKLGFEVDLLCYLAGNEKTHQNLRIFRSSSLGLNTNISIGPSFKKIILDLPLFFKAISLCASNKYSAIHGVEEAGIMAMLLHKIFRLPYVFDMHSWMSEQLDNHNFIRSSVILELFRKIELYCMRNASGIITVGQYMTDLLKTMTPNVPAHTLNDLPLELSQHDNTNLVSKIRHDYIGPAKVTLLYTGNFHSYQGIDLLLRSYAVYKELSHKKFTSKLLLVGGGVGEQSIVDSYRNLATALGIEREVVFCGEHPVESMPAFIECADILISPRISGNNVPLKIYTYLASGKLTVATNIESHTQVLNEDNSILANPTPEDFGKALFDAVANISPEKATWLKANAYKDGQRDLRQVDFANTLKKCYEFIYSLSIGVLGSEPFSACAILF